MLTPLFTPTESHKCFGQSQSQPWFLTLQQWENVTPAPLKGSTGFASACEVAEVSLQHTPFVLNPMHHVWYSTNPYKPSGSRQSIFSWKLLPSPPPCVCQKGIKLHHIKAERKILYFWNFIFQSQVFPCIRLSINLRSCNFDLFTPCLQHRLQSHLLLNGL